MKRACENANVRRCDTNLRQLSNSDSVRVAFVVVAECEIDEENLMTARRRFGERKICGRVALTITHTN